MGSLLSFFHIETGFSLNDFTLEIYAILQHFLKCEYLRFAVYDSVAVQVNAGSYSFKTSGKTLVFKGYTAVYDDSKKEEDEENALSLLPNVVNGEPLTLIGLTKEQKFTNPPSRYTEARLIRKMEELATKELTDYSFEEYDALWKQAKKEIYNDEK